MDDEKVEDKTMVDELSDHVCDLIGLMEEMDPTSEEYAVVSNAVDKLSPICIRIREIEMKYDDLESQREHEMTIKQLELNAAKIARETEERLKNLERLEEKRWHNIELGLKIAAMVVSALGTGAFVWTSWCQTRMNYVDNVYDVSSASRMVLNAIGKRINPPMN